MLPSPPFYQNQLRPTSKLNMSENKYSQQHWDNGAFILFDAYTLNYILASCCNKIILLCFKHFDCPSLVCFQGVAVKPQQTWQLTTEKLSFPSKSYTPKKLTVPNRRPKSLKGNELMAFGVGFPYYSTPFWVTSAGKGRCEFLQESSSNPQCLWF